MSRLQNLADRAVSIYSREKISASNAVRKAVDGEGLNREQLHRVSTMANRTIHKMDKTSKAGSPLWTSRWETSKPEDIIKSSAEGSVRDMKVKGDPEQEAHLGSGGSREGSGPTPFEASLDHQLSSLRKLRKALDGDVDGGLAKDTSHGDNADATVAPITPEIADSLLKDITPLSKRASVDALDVAPSYGQSGIPVEELQFSKVSNSIVHPKHREDRYIATRYMNDVESAKASLDLLQDRIFEYQGAIKTASVKLSDAKFSRAAAKASLLNAISFTVKKSGLTLGEALECVKLSLEHPEVTGGVKVSHSGWLLDIVEEAIVDHGIDLDAALGELRDSKGNLLSGRVKEAQAQLSIRASVVRPDEYGEVIQNLDAPLVKASKSYFDACLYHEDLTEAHYRLHESLTECQKLVDQAQEDFKHFKSLPDSVIRAAYQ